MVGPVGIVKVGLMLLEVVKLGPFGIVKEGPLGIVKVGQ